MSGLTVVGLFAGIGGIELGLRRAGHHCEGLVEIDASAQRVLVEQFPEVPLWDDVRRIKRLPVADVLAAGFPCQDLSQAGSKRGITGPRSRLVNHVFRLCTYRDRRPGWILLENVSYMLNLRNGRAMERITSAVERLGYVWAYRVVDARAFGIPQRRKRVIFLASRVGDPRQVLFADEATAVTHDNRSDKEAACYGFYWTEGLRGLGWTQDAVPTIKAGSRLGIPSQPAVWSREVGLIGTPRIEDGERLQGFPSGWTRPQDGPAPKVGVRWRQLGNAVCVPMAKWVGERLLKPSRAKRDESPLRRADAWPSAAWGYKGKRFNVAVGEFPFARKYSLSHFLTGDLVPLSFKATFGFYCRARRSNLRFADGFLEAVWHHLSRVPLTLRDALLLERGRTRSARTVASVVSRRRRALA